MNKHKRGGLAGLWDSISGNGVPDAPFGDAAGMAPPSFGLPPAPFSPMGAPSFGASPFDVAPPAAPKMGQPKIGGVLSRIGGFFTDKDQGADRMQVGLEGASLLASLLAAHKQGKVEDEERKRERDRATALAPAYADILARIGSHMGG